MPITTLQGLISDTVFSLPAEDVHRSCGVALDIGSTVGKVVYRSNKDYKNGQPLNAQEDATRGMVHYAMFPRADVTGMISYIKDNCDLMADTNGELLVKSSGVGGAAFRTQIETALNCKIKILQEYDCFTKAFLAVEKTTPAEELFMPLSPDNQAVVDAEAEKHRNEFQAMMEKMKGHSEINFGPAAGAGEVKEEDLPRLLMMSGSGSAVMQLNGDGTFSLIDGVYMGGRYMYGLACILTGENDYDKLMDMAQSSDGKTVDTWLSDLLGDENTAGATDNPYEMMREKEDKRTFPFGKGVNTPAEKMKKGDLAYSVFNTTAELHAHLIGSCVKISKAREVYVAGNAFSSECMKVLISKVLAHRQVWLNPGFEYRVRFLRNGGMYGALGAFLNTE